jgi:hypothetical protein
MQYFYIVSHSGDDELRINDKVFLQEEKAINWGRKQATKFPANDYWLQRCPITSTGVVTDYKSLFPFKGQKIKVEEPIITIDWQE